MLPIIAIALAAAFLLRFDFVLPPAAFPLLLEGLAISLIVKLVVFQLAGFHQGWMHYVESSDLARILPETPQPRPPSRRGFDSWSGQPFPRTVLFHRLRADAAAHRKHPFHGAHAAGDDYIGAHFTA